MNRPLKLSIMLALAVGSAHVAAQSLGQVQVKSALDQPLLAEIAVISEAGSDTAHLEVALASEEAYAHAGVNRSGLPTDLQLVVTANAQGQKVIRVTSTAPVSDTYLDILVELRTGKSNAVREVTMLLDPPSTKAMAPVSGVASRRGSSAASSSSATPAASSAMAATAPARRTEAAAPTPAPAPVSKPAASKAAVSGDGNYGPVERGQTLSSIARKAGGDADINQMLLALKKANPDAFYRDNVNALKTGAVLRIPSGDDVQAQTAVAALAEVRRQNEEWRGSAARSPSVVADAAVTEKAAPTPAPASTPKTDRLALVPAKAGGQSASTRAGVAGGKGDTSLAGLRQELTSSEEALSALKQQGDELKSRVGDLEDINQKNQRLLSLKDAEIAELQQKLAELQKSSGATAAAAPVAAPTPAKADVAAPQANPAPASAGTTVITAVPPAPAGSATVATAPLKDSTAVVGAPVAKPVPAKPVVAHPFVAQADAEPWYTQPWAWAVAAGGVVVLLLLALSGRRKKKVVAPVVGSSSLADRFGDASLMDDYDYDAEHGMDADQRELLDELSEHPDDVGLHLELVSLYYSRRDVEHFEAAAEAMYAHIGDAQHAEWAEVVRMGEDLVPNHPLFRASPLPPQTDDEHGALEQFNLDSYATGGEHQLDGEASVPPPLPKRNSEYHFNFDLSPEYADVVKPTVIVNSDTSVEHHAEPVDHLESFTALDDHPQATHEPVSPPVVAPPVVSPAGEPESIWHFEEPEFADDTHAAGDQDETFSDDPADTKLDLARAYLDMGDAEGARAMLDEVIAEGTQMQKDVAKRMLENMT